jgi:hypothetical protein
MKRLTSFLLSFAAPALALSAGPPTIVSLTPNSGTGRSVTFQAVYSDPNGAADLNEILLQVNTGQSSANACYVYYHPQTNQLYLANDAGTVWMTPALTPGSAETATNSQCTLLAQTSSVSTAGNNLTLSVVLTFSNMLVGPRSVYLYAGGLSGQNSGWVKEGTWLPNPGVGAPTILGLSPSSGTGTSVTFQTIYSDPSGAAELSETLLQVNSIQSGANACYVYYQPQGNHLYLANNAGTAWMTPALTPGVAGMVSNSQCTLNAASSSVSTAGNDLYVNVALTFSSTFVGSKNVYAYAGALNGGISGWESLGTWEPQATAGPPAIVSLSPNTGSGAAVTFQAVYTDPNGAADLNEILLQVNTGQSAGNACYVYYQPQANQLYLANDAGTVWMTPALTPGVAGTASNSQCTLNAGSSSVSLSGNNLTLDVALSFDISTTVVGKKNVYLYAGGISGQNSGWVKEGTWTPYPANASATIVSLSPNSGSGTSVTFTAVYSDPYGAGDLSEVDLLLSATAPAKNSAGVPNACYVAFDPPNRLYLVSDPGGAMGPLTIGQPGTLSNSQCTLNAGLSSVSTSGNDMTLNIVLSFTKFAGLQNVYLDAEGRDAADSSWVNKGTWTPIPGSANPPAIVSLSPPTGGGTSVTFQAVYSDPAGAADLNELLLLVNTSQSTANACYVYYQPSANLLYLADDAGTAWLTPALTPGAAGTVSNSQCVLNAGSSSVSTSGNNLTLNAALSFKSSFAGLVYLYAAGSGGRNTGWVQEGTWSALAGTGPPAIVSLSPGSGSGTSVTFQAVYSDADGTSDLNELLLLVNTSQTGANGCYVYYQPQGDHLFLANDAGTAWITPSLTPGIPGTASNSQCTLNAGSSFATISGSNVTLDIALSFSGTFVGLQNVYLYAGGISGLNSGWVNEGTWTP